MSAVIRLENGKSVEVEIAKCEASLKYNPNNLDILLQLAELYMRLGTRSKITYYVVACLKQYLTSPASVEKGMVTINVALRFWRAEKYVNRENLRLNISAERSEVYLNCERILSIMDRVKDTSLFQRVQVLLAGVKAGRGQFTEALEIYSELITNQAMDGGVEYTFIIFQAAILLKHIGQNAQSIEYLEFLIDDPPVQDGYSKMHVLAFLVLVYEQSGSHYSVVKERTYEELLQSYQSELSAGKKPQTNKKKIENMLSKKTLGESSEIWEMLGLQALERCDYVYAVELFKQAAFKAPGKSRLHFLLSELYYLLNNLDQALACAEKAYSLNSSSPELRNMLLMLAPEVWTEKLRSAAAAVTKQDDLLSPTKSGGISRINDRGTSPGRNVSGPHGRGEHWLSKVKTKAEGALNRVKKEGEKQVSNLMTRARSVSPGRKRGNRGGTEEVGNVDRLEEMQNEAKQQAAKEKAIKKEAIAKKKAERELPAKPIKPELDGDTRILLRQIMSGDVGMMHLYEEDLKKMVEIRKETLGEEERAVKARMKEKAAKAKAAKK